MNERTRLTIHTVGVLVVFTIIIVMRFVFYYRGAPLDFLRGEFIFYTLGILTILIFTLFLVSSTDSSGSYKSDKAYAEKLQKSKDEIVRLKKSISEQKKKINKIEAKFDKLKQSNIKTIEELDNLKVIIKSTIIHDKSLISSDLGISHPIIHLAENHFLTQIDNLKDLASKGVDSYQLESSIAYIGSIQIYKMLTYAIEKTNEFDFNEIDDLLNEYASILNATLKYVEVVNYGYKNTYEATSHMAMGFIDDHDQINPKSFKISSRDTGSIIYKALVRKV